jgi:hypothetical protein
MRKKDYAQEPVKITSISESDDWYDISASYLSGGNIGFGLSKHYNVVPKVGDKIVLYSAGGCEIRGMDLNGKKIYYKSQKQMDDEHAEWCRKYAEQ